MKDINFITPVTPTKQREIRLWFSSTLILLCLIIGAVSTLHFMQLRILKKVAAERKILTQKVSSFDLTLEQQHSLKQEEEKLATRLHHITQKQEHPKNPVDYLQCIAGACGTAISIQSLKVENDFVEIVAQCGAHEDVTAFMNALEATASFKELNLVSLKAQEDDPAQRLVTFSVRGSTVARA